jgi:hypothetical protein
MEKGHYGQYTGNARHSRKEEMIHDRELIYDAKKQLHRADKDYKHDSPAKNISPSIHDKIGSDVNKTQTVSKNKPTASMASIGTDSRVDISKAAGGIGTFKENFPSSSSQPSSMSTSRSSYVPTGEARRERRLGKAERKADLKRSQKKHIAANRLEKKASRIKDRAYIKGDAGSYNQYPIDSPATMYGKKEGSPAKNSGLGPKTAGSGMYMRACGYKK